MDQQPPSSLGRGSRTVVVVVALLSLIGLTGLGWLVVARLQEQAVVQPPPPKAAEPAPPPEEDLQEAEADAAFAADAGLAEPVARWLAQPGVVRLLAAAVWQVSEGESPREPLRFLAPTGAFSVESRDGRTFMSSESAARYDFLAKALASVDAAQAGAFYGRTQKYLAAAFRGISPPGRTFLGAVDKALVRLDAVPLTDGPLEVVAEDGGAPWRFADPALEQLDPSQKHLLRLGPANARVVLRQLHAFREAARASE